MTINEILSKARQHPETYVNLLHWEGLKNIDLNSHYWKIEVMWREEPQEYVLQGITYCRKELQRVSILVSSDLIENIEAYGDNPFEFAFTYLIERMDQDMTYRKVYICNLEKVPRA